MRATISRLEKRGPVRVIGVRGATATRSVRLKSVIVWILTRGVEINQPGRHPQIQSQPALKLLTHLGSKLGLERKTPCDHKQGNTRPFQLRAQVACTRLDDFGCPNDEPLGFDLDMAFQPIIDVSTNQRVWGMSDAVYEPTACIRATLEAANRTGFDRSRLCSNSPKTSLCGTRATLVESSRPLVISVS